MDLQTEIKLQLEADSIKTRLDSSNSICEIAEIIDSADEDMVRRVLKKYVFNRH
jgi:hypothetical protein